MDESLRTAIELLLAVELSSLSDAAVREGFVALRACAELVELACARWAAAVEQRGLADADGAVSTPAWIEHHTGQVRAEARVSVRTGAALEDFPAVAAAWEAGAISASAARRIMAGRRAGAEGPYSAIEPMLVEFAERREYRSLHQAIRYYQACVEHDALPVEPEGLFLHPVGDRWHVHGTLDAATGEFVAAALDAASAPPAADDPRTPAQRRASALGLVAKTFCDLGHGECEHGNAPHVNVLVDWATIAEPVPYATIGRSGAPIGRRVLDRLLCEADITRIVTGERGEVLDVGRAQRTPTKALRTAVIVRDQHCRFPGCDRPPGWSEIHHVVAWQHGGPTDLDNLVLLCGHHHHVVHRPGWQAVFDGDEFVVTNPQRREQRSRAPVRAPVEHAA